MAMGMELDKRLEENMYEMYEALKEARTWKNTPGVRFPTYMFAKMDKILAKIEGKDG